MARSFAESAPVSICSALMSRSNSIAGGLPSTGQEIVPAFFSSRPDSLNVPAPIELLEPLSLNPVASLKG